MNSNVTEKFISAVMKYPFLYDKTQSDFRDTKKKEKMWTEIGKKFNNTAEQSQKYFKSLREKYSRIKKLKELSTRSGAGANKNIEWDMYDMMSFLDEVIRPRKTVGSFNFFTMNQSRGLPETNIEVTIDSSISNDELMTAGILAEVPLVSPSSNSAAGSVCEDFDSAPTPQVTQRQSTIRSATPRSRKRTKEEMNTSVASSLALINENLSNDIQGTPYDPFCSFLNAEMNELPKDLAEEMKDEFLTILIQKRKVARSRNMEQ